ncbi:MAG: hypothetical protein ACRC3A_02455 [Culicoidibacterales bacterium]
MKREIATIKLIGFGILFVYSIIPLIAPAFYAEMSTFAAVAAGVYVILCVLCGWLGFVNHSRDYSLVFSAVIFTFATTLALFWPTALGYLIYFGLIILAYLIPTISGFRTLAKNKL